MRMFLTAAGLLASLVAIATPARAVTTWEGVSVAVPDEETGVSEFYTVRFTFNDMPPRFVVPLTAQDPDRTPYVLGLYENITSISVTGPKQSASFDSGVSRVSTLAPALAGFGTNPFLILAGTDGSIPGLAMQFSYSPPTAYGSIAMPGSLDIAAPTGGAPGTAYASFNLQRYDYEGDPADETIGEPVTLLNFFIASGGFLPSATAVPEPATWATMIVGMGLIGGTLRRRRATAALA